jgi:two-component system chemotaxis response regulator CheY
MRVKSLRFMDSSRTFRCTDWKIAPLSPQAACAPVKKRKVVLSTSSTIRKITQNSLRQANLNVGDILEASNGREALGMVQRFTFDLTLTDIDMPLMDGLELRKCWLMFAGPRTPVVVITEHTSQEGALRVPRRCPSLYPEALYGEGTSPKRLSPCTPISWKRPKPGGF